MWRCANGFCLDFGDLGQLWSGLRELPECPECRKSPEMNELDLVLWDVVLFIVNGPLTAKLWSAQVARRRGKIRVVDTKSEKISDFGLNDGMDLQPGQLHFLPSAICATLFAELRHFQNIPLITSGLQYISNVPNFLFFKILIFSNFFLDFFFKSDFQEGPSQVLEPVRACGGPPWK